MRSMLERAMGRASSTLSPGHRHLAQVILSLFSCMYRSIIKMLMIVQMVKNLRGPFLVGISKFSGGRLNLEFKHLLVVYHVTFITDYLISYLP